MGGIDKGLVEIAGRPMIGYVLEALRSQVDRVLINANRNLNRYAALDVEVVSDRLADYQGPLAGIASALSAASTPLVTTVPCDAPLLPTNLVQRLLAPLREADAEIAVVSVERRLQPVFLLMRRSVLAGLQAYLAGGERKIDRWFPTHRWISVDLSDCSDCFINVNSPADAAAVTPRLPPRYPEY